jgi:hypothetical protein
MLFIFLLIDHTRQEILAQHELAMAQYNSAFNKLSQINAMVDFLLDLLDNTRHVSIFGHNHFVLVDQNHRVLPNLISVHSLEVLSNV